jgi:hypothetical protein
VPPTGVQQKNVLPHRTFFGQVCHIFSFGDRQESNSLGFQVSDEMRAIRSDP